MNIRRTILQAAFACMLQASEGLPQNTAEAVHQTAADERSGAIIFSLDTTFELIAVKPKCSGECFFKPSPEANPQVGKDLEEGR